MIIESQTMRFLKDAISEGYWDSLVRSQSLFLLARPTFAQSGARKYHELKVISEEQPSVILKCFEVADDLGLLVVRFLKKSLSCR